jgi:hypothetical protein
METMAARSAFPSVSSRRNAELVVEGSFRPGPEQLPVRAGGGSDEGLDVFPQRLPHYLVSFGNEEFPDVDVVGGFLRGITRHGTGGGDDAFVDDVVAVPIPPVMRRDLRQGEAHPAPPANRSNLQVVM